MIVCLSDFLVKTDCVCDYIPLVSSVTNVFDIFHKCIILILMDKRTIENNESSNHYFKHLNQKSFVRCFWLIIPVIGNIIVGILDCSKKRAESSCMMLHPDNVESLTVGSLCAESYPCQHQATVVLRNGREASPINSNDLHFLISQLPLEKIHPGDNNWNAAQIKSHFCSNDA